MTRLTPEAKQESDTPITDAYRAAAMSTTANDWLFRIAKLERQLSAVTAERDAFSEELGVRLAERDALRVDAERYESLLKRCVTALELTPAKWRNGEHIALPSRIKAAIDAARGAK